jgi:hypothetical protein
MWYQQSEQLLLVREHQDQIRTDAIEARFANRSGRFDRSLVRVSGLRLQLGGLLIVVGRTLHEDETPCPDLMRS